MEITFDLSTSSIKKAQNLVQRYEKVVQQESGNFHKSIAQDGIDILREELSTHIYTGQTMASLMVLSSINSSVIQADGRLSWLEFGTGVVANGGWGYPHPTALENGLPSIGTYGLGHGSSPKGWVYYDDFLGRYNHTYGHKAAMPMYNTMQRLKSRDYLQSKVKEVFKV